MVNWPLVETETRFKFEMAGTKCSPPKILNFILISHYTPMLILKQGNKKDVFHKLTYSDKIQNLEGYIFGKF